MVFNSVDFLIFFPIVYLLYLRLNLKGQNVLLLIASYFFYGYWDYRFLSLLFISTIIDYLTSLQIEKSHHNIKRRKLFLIISLASNLGILGFFKYYNFFIGSAASLLTTLGVNANPVFLNIALPLGISFYTFQTMSYTIDVYRGDLKAERNFINFALFVSFFPQLVAGPIERATNLLPQVTKERIITKENLKQGAFLVLFGYFKKVYVADNLATIVDPVFNSNHNNPLVQVVDPSGAMVLIACIAFSFQIYADFAGYSEIARGIAKFMGFELMRNFNHPVFSVNPAELWKRWHISLMSWFKDYIYRPLGTDNDSKFVQHRNNLVVFFVSGLWHGANWTFVMWGVYSGVLLTIYRIVKPFLPKPKEESSRIIYIVKFIIKCSLVYGSFALSAVFFRAQNISESFHYLHNVIFQFGNLVPNVSEKLFRYIIILLAVEAYQFYKNDEFAFFKSPVWVRTFLYVLLFECILILGNCNNNEFIYFVF